MRTSVPLVIICRDRLSPLVRLVDWLTQANCDQVILLDNDSRWPPLLEFYQRSPFEVVRLKENLGSQAPWLSGLVDERFTGRHYAVTDPDVVPAEECPYDLLDHLAAVLDRHPQRIKVGVGLKIDDLPASYRHANDAMSWESVHWAQEIEPGLFDAPVDTTLAVYRVGGSHGISPALRTGPPYVARHMTWYTNSTVLTDEDRFYRARASVSGGTGTNWSGKRLPRRIRQYAHVRRTGGHGVRSKLIRAQMYTESVISRHLLRHR